MTCQNTAASRAMANTRPCTPWDELRNTVRCVAFEHLDGRHANLTPDSPDLPKIADTLTWLGQIQAPDLPLRPLEHRLADLTDDSTLTLLAGEHLLHTDLNPHNILIGEHPHLVD